MIAVACCLIHNEKGQILLAQKESGCWEFPGGKVDEGETILECAEREILEELGIIVSAVCYENISTIVGEAPRAFELMLISCNYMAGDINLTEHLDAKWVSQEEVGLAGLCGGDKVLWELRELTQLN